MAAGPIKKQQEQQTRKVTYGIAKISSRIFLGKICIIVSCFVSENSNL